MLRSIGLSSVGGKHDRMSTKIFSATYDRRRDMVAITLSTGATIAVPRSTLSRLAEIAPKDLVSVQIEPPGYSIWFEHPDIGLHLDTILQAGTGNASRSIAASAMGSATSSGKVAAVRANGRKGGRPMTMTSFVAALDHQFHLLRPEAPNVHVSDNPNPATRERAWNCGPHRWYVKFHGMKDVQVQRSWNSTEPPIPTAECRDGETTRERPRKKRRRAGHDQVVASIFFASLAVSGTL